MENASDAFVMAGQMLIFIIALTVCISSFTTVRTEVNRIVGENEEIRMAKDGDNYINFMESKNSSSTRVVESDTLVTSMYRAIKENYVIYIKFKDSNTINSVRNNRYIQTTTAKVTKTTAKGNTIINAGDTLIKITIGSDTNQEVDMILKKYDRETNSGGNLFEIVKTKKFNEYLGEYQKETGDGVSSENKETFRIITYIEV